MGKHVIFLVLAMVLGAAAVLAAPLLSLLMGQRPNTEIVYRIMPDERSTRSLQPQDNRALMADVVRVLGRRARQMGGYAEQAGPDTVRVRIRTDEESRQDLAVIGSSATLEFYYLKDVQNVNDPMGRWRMEAPATEEGSYVFTGTRGETIDSLRQPRDLMDQVVNYKANRPVLTGSDLLPNARANTSAGNRVVISIEFNEQGREVFRKFTARHVDEYLAVFFDHRLLTAPRINEAILGGKAEISGFRTLVEARRTTEILNAGALPCPLKMMSYEHPGPSRDTTPSPGATTGALAAAAVVMVALTIIFWPRDTHPTQNEC